jgi:hypothetical protein
LRKLQDRFSEIGPRELGLFLRAGPPVLCTHRHAMIRAGDACSHVLATSMPSAQACSQISNDSVIFVAASGIGFMNGSP